MITMYDYDYMTMKYDEFPHTHTKKTKTIRVHGAKRRETVKHRRVGGRELDVFSQKVYKMSAVVAEQQHINCTSNQHDLSVRTIPTGPFLASDTAILTSPTPSGPPAGPLR